MAQKITIVENILSANDRMARENHNRLEEAGVFSINILASPGAGKTSLIEQTLPRLKGRLRVAAIDGDIATSIDSDRAAAAGALAASSRGNSKRKRPSATKPTSTAHQSVARRMSNMQAVATSSGVPATCTS